jgi:hypothetical protein
VKRFWKILFDEPICVGSVVKYRVRHSQYTQSGLGEVIAKVGKKPRQKLELLLLNKRLAPVLNSDQSFKRRTVLREHCKHIDVTFVPKSKKQFEIGDIVCRNILSIKKYGVIIGFKNPDELFSTSYESGFNYTDLIDCVEINPKSLRRLRDDTGGMKKFQCPHTKLKICQVDLWDESGVKLSM